MKRTHKHLLFSLTLIIIIMVSCDLFNDLIDFSFVSDEVEIGFTVNPSEAGEYTFVEKIMQSDIEAEIQENGGQMVDLKNVTVEEARLEMLTTGENLDAFNRAEVFIKSDSQPEIMIGSVENIGDGLLSVDFVITDASVLQFLEDEEYTVRVAGYLGEDILTTVDLAVYVRYKVEVGS